MAIFVGRVSSKGSSDKQGPKVTETWQIVDDTGDDCGIGPIACMLHPDVPKIGNHYAPGTCDSVYLGLVVERVAPGDLRKDTTKGSCWREITVDYGVDSSTPNGGRPGLPNFNKPDPVTWVPSLEISDNPRRVVAERLQFLGALLQSDIPASGDPCEATAEPLVPIEIDNAAVSRQIGSIAPVATTAGEQFNPPEEVDYYDTHFRLTLFTSDWDSEGLYDCYRGSVNDAEVHLEIPQLNFDKVCAKHTLKMRSIQGRPGYREWRDASGAQVSRQYWSVTMDILYRRSGWYVEKLNVGTKRVLKGKELLEALDDGYGGVFNNSTDFPAGVSIIGDILDLRGRPVDRAQWLDIQGQAINQENTASRLVLRYLDGFEKDWNNTDLGLSLA